MKWNILHESRGRIRLHLRKPRMSLAEADQLQDYLTSLPGVRTAAVYERTCDVVIVYTESRAGIVRGLAAFRFDTEALAEVPANSPRAVNREYQEKLVNMTIFHLARKLFLPAPLRMVYTLVRSVPYIFRGLRCVFRRRLEVEVLDSSGKHLATHPRAYGQASTNSEDPSMQLALLCNKPASWPNSRVRDALPDPLREWLDRQDRQTRNEALQTLKRVDRESGWANAVEAMLSILESTGGADRAGVTLLAARLAEGVAGIEYDDDRPDPGEYDIAFTADVGVQEGGR